MEVQTESSKPPPVEPQSSGKINKAAFKLFGKRHSRAGMASIFSVRNKGEGGGSGSGVKAEGKALELVRSKTHDGIITSAATSTSPLSDGPEGTPGRPAESSSSDQLQSAATPSTRSSLSKSLSFFSLLRRSSVRGGDAGGSGGPAGAVVGRRGRGGLRGFFSSLRWRRKERPSQEEVAAPAVAGETQEGQEVRVGDVVLTASRSESVEVIKEGATLTLDPDRQAPAAEDGGSRSAPVHSGKLEAEAQGTRAESGRESPPLPHAVFDERSPDVSPLRVSISRARDGEVKLGSPARLAADSCLTPPLERSLADPPSEPSVDRLCSMFNDVTSLKSFDSLTGCGDIIADVEDEPGNGGSGTSSGTSSSNGGGGRRASERGSPAKPTLTSQVTAVPVSTFLPAHQRARAAAAATPTNAASTGASAAGPKKPSTGKRSARGSGVVAYMGGGEEMASPEGVDDADMQGLWHMLPQKGEDSLDLPRSDHGLHHAPVTPSSARAEKQRTTPPVKGLGLSKIPVCGSGRPGKQQQPARPSPPPTDKELQDAPTSDEGYWDSPTPVAEDEDAGVLHRELRLPRESCSGDALYDLYDPDSPGAAGSDEDDLSSPSPSTDDVNLTQAQSSCSSSFRSMKGSTSLPRDSKIPVSVRHTPPPHSSSQGELSAAVSPTPPVQPPAKSNIPPPRTRIPVSKVPMRRSAANGNKPASTTRNRK
ncbi:APC membrane recruitment protein 2 [Alosa alosa]|uniref:APC membrane recruitment protein 2 n=1 Tax=Alosa alosa TaxID=278164 RepID=UPI00201514CF|nr:APC membrane recruitment protein 2 [Alosa alosa]